MTTKEDILRGVEEIIKNTADAADAEPVFEIICFQHANKELVGKRGKPLGFPDFGATDPVGFFHDIEDAINAVKNNSGDMHETLYDAAFVVCRFPGLYQCVGTSYRMYFVYDPEIDGYVQQEEPVIFAHSAI